jgi:hypothetical protein
MTLTNIKKMVQDGTHGTRPQYELCLDESDSYQAPSMHLNNNNDIY